MTQEEKYRKALLEARAVLEPCLKYSRGKVCAALDSIDKELKSFESEDERIREWLVYYFKAIGKSWLHHRDISIEQILAWLEKQKEPKHATDSKSERVIKAARSVLNNWLDGTDCPDVSGDFAELEYAIREYDGDDKQKEQGPISFNVPFNPDDYEVIMQGNATGLKQKEHQSCSDAPKEKSVGGDFYSSHKDKNLDEIAQDYVDGVKEYNPEPTWDLMQTAVCYGANWQKEQFEKNRLANCDALSKEECDRETDFAMEIIEKEHRQPTFNDAINYGMRLQEEQKPEWSEEDKRKLNRIYSIIGWAMDEHAFSSCKKLLGDKEGVELQDFLRSIAKPKQEWSEEDEKMLNEVLDRVTYAFYEQGNEGEIEDDPAFLWLHRLWPS